MPTLVVNLVIAPDEYQRMYSGAARHVSTVSVDGRKVQFPANILRPYVTRGGIRGRFMIRFSSDNRFESIQRL
ncbi:DUF2835 domain-containing protein [Pseudomaricurvus sp.]|uniref:DUF2835 domain-containing protein n=1 Tax=Pseudomaricurvus sp. TaxID=2004510 RepID=UPI003F6B824E